MILVKRLTKQEVLKVVAALVKETLPECKEGRLLAKFDSEFGIEVTFIENEEVQELN